MLIVQQRPPKRPLKLLAFNIKSIYANQQTIFLFKTFFISSDVLHGPIDDIVTVRFLFCVSSNLTITC